MSRYNKVTATFPLKYCLAELPEGKDGRTGVIDPRGRPTDILYSARLTVPGALKDRLWSGEGYSEQVVYAHTLAHQTRSGRLVGTMMYWGIVDPSSEAFGLLLWQYGSKVDCRRCHCEVLRWSERSVFCSQRCRRLWLLSRDQVATEVA